MLHRDQPRQELRSGLVGSAPPRRHASSRSAARRACRAPGEFLRRRMGQARIAKICRNDRIARIRVSSGRRQRRAERVPPRRGPRATLRRGRAHAIRPGTAPSTSVRASQSGASVSTAAPPQPALVEALGAVLPDHWHDLVRDPGRAQDGRQPGHAGGTRCARPRRAAAPATGASTRGGASVGCPRRRGAGARSSATMSGAAAAARPSPWPTPPRGARGRATPRYRRRVPRRRRPARRRALRRPRGRASPAPHAPGRG